MVTADKTARSYDEKFWLRPLNTAKLAKAVGNHWFGVWPISSLITLPFWFLPPKLPHLHHAACFGCYTGGLPFCTTQNHDQGEVKPIADIPEISWQWTEIPSVSELMLWCNLGSPRRQLVRWLGEAKYVDLGVEVFRGSSNNVAALNVAALDMLRWYQCESQVHAVLHIYR